VTESNLRQFREHLKNYEDGPRRRFRVLGPRRKPAPKPEIDLSLPTGNLPPPRMRGGVRFPWYTLVLLVTLFFLMKAFVVLRIGEDSIRDRLAAYDGGNWGERIGVFFMTPDPVSVTLSDLARPVLDRR
jgi:hypothetical protein